MDLDDEELAATRVMHGLDKIDGSDINVGSIEEDIKILEKFLKEMDDVFQQTKINNTKERKALANLLEDYKKQKQESKKWEQMYLDEVDKRVDVILLYNKLLEENKELKAKLEFKQWGDLDDLRFEEYMNEFVPKQKIKDKFNEIQLLYEKNLKEVNLKEVEKIDKKIFEGISLEAQREFARELLQQEDKQC